MKLLFKYLFLSKSKKKFIKDNIDSLLYEPDVTHHEPNEDANKAYKGIDHAYFSMTTTDFKYFLNAIQNKINTYRKLNK